jgi:hypothetical protein
MLARSSLPGTRYILLGDTIQDLEEFLARHQIFIQLAYGSIIASSQLYGHKSYIPVGLCNWEAHASIWAHSLVV